MKRRASFHLYTGFALLVVVLVTIAVFQLLSTPEQRTDHYRLSLFVLIFCQVITFGYAILHKSYSSNKKVVPAFFSIASLIYIYDVVVIVNLILFWWLFSTTFPVYLSIHLIALALFLITAAFLPSYIQRAGKEEEHIKRNTGLKNKSILVIDEILVKAGSLQAEESDKSLLQEKLTALKEEFIYSDPISDPGISHLEEKIALMLEQLDTAVSKVLEEGRPQDLVALIKQISEVSNTLSMRNKTLVGYK